MKMFGGEDLHFGGEASPPPPPVDRILAVVGCISVRRNRVCLRKSSSARVEPGYISIVKKSILINCVSKLFLFFKRS